MKFLDNPDERTRALKKKLFGENIVLDTSEYYDEIGMLLDLGIHYPDWKEKFSVRHRAMVRARYILGNMVRIVEMYNEEQDRANKKLREG